MPNEHATTEGEYAFPWTADHLAAADEQIRLCEFVARDGTATITLDLQNYLSLHRYVRELVLTLDATKRASDLNEERARLLHLANALRAYRRPVGRPRKLSTIAKGSGLLAQFANEARKPASKGGRPPSYPMEFLAELNAAVIELWNEKYSGNLRFNVSAALKDVLREFAKSKGVPRDETEQKVADIFSDWYKPLMKYRAAHGERLNAKSQNLRKNALNFQPLLANFGRWQTANHSGKHHAATKGRHGTQTGKARGRRK